MGLLRGLVGKVGSRLGRGREATSAAGHPQAAPGVAPPRGPAPRGTPAAPVDPAAELATLDCGAQELKERVEAGEHVVIVDVRVRERAALGSLPGARCLPLAELEARWQELAQADEIVCACDDGEQSGRAALLLRDRGLINATRLEGGIRAWTAIGGRLAPASP
ncbi:rhodanese-like domain-containing protein [Myxococcota bacterium]|nr:rhodanese-like domain-containing protein [Myxococcota bacterium]